MTKDRKTGANIFEPWFADGECSAKSVRILQEREGGRAEIFEALVEVAADHLIGLKVIKSLGGFPKASHLLTNRIPKEKITRSGMLGEILATEFLDQETEFTAPIRRLRHRDTRELAMRGDDVIGLHLDGSRIRVMKVEAKSRAKLSQAAIEEARDGLAKHKGRPNPETLAFIECMLRMDERDDEAEPFSQLQQQTIRSRDICHLLFTLSGNDPTKFLEGSCAEVRRGIDLRLCGCHVKKHDGFVKDVFDRCMTRGEEDGGG